MEDRDRHIHRCDCGTRWACSKPNCYLIDECSRCECEALERWAEQNSPRQMVLEPEEALLSAQKDGQ
jgi:hypothetical protein